jgi:hypothetical protein
VHKGLFTDEQLRDLYSQTVAYYKMLIETGVDALLGADFRVEMQLFIRDLFYEINYWRPRQERVGIAAPADGDFTDEQWEVLVNSFMTGVDIHKALPDLVALKDTFGDDGSDHWYDSIEDYLKKHPDWYEHDWFKEAIRD